jgi:2-isopropylmalate synthase
MNSHGIDSGLDFSRLNDIREVYERTTRMTVPERQPYSGELVFTAFSGSHQDAIKKGFDRRNKDVVADPTTYWGVPYLTIDPSDIGRPYEAIIRINSQSGKGGIAYILDREHGFDLPKTMHPQVGLRIYSVADEESRELSVAEIRDLFFQHFVNIGAPLELVDYELDHHAVSEKGIVVCRATITVNAKSQDVEGQGNGPINSLKDFTLTDYRSHAVRGGSDADSAAYVQIKSTKVPTKIIWGCGVDPSIEMAGLRALVCAYNLLTK